MLATAEEWLGRSAPGEHDNFFEVQEVGMPCEVFQRAVFAPVVSESHR